MNSLSDRIVSGVFWSSLQKIGAKGITFLVTIFLARLLTPKDFGLIGMLTIFIQISQTIVQGGFKQALIQKKEVDEEDYSSVFYINLVVGLLFYLLLFALAPYIAAFYDQPILTSLTRILSIIFVVNAFSFIQESRLIKKMQFKTLMLIHIPSTIIGGVISVAMAFLGFGVWSIVVMQLARALVYAIQIWIYSKWRPLLFFNMAKAKLLFSFGSKLLLSQIVTTIYNNIYSILIGKFYPVQSVGYYQNSYNLVMTPSNELTNVVGEVTFPAFSEIQEDNGRLKFGYKKAMQQVFFWVCPLYVFAGVLANPIFSFLFTERWLPAVPYFQWLCIVGIFQPLIVYNANVIVVKGRTDILLKLQFIRRMVTIVTTIAIFPFGITAILIVQALSAIFSFCLFGYHTKKFIQYPILDQLKDLLPTAIVSLLIGFGLWMLDKYFLETLNIIKLLIGFSFGLALYIGISHIFQLNGYIDFRQIFLSRATKKVFKK